MTDQQQPFADALRERPHLIGVVHVPPLAAAARPGPPLTALLARVAADARAYLEGGADALLLENYGDAPFRKGAADPHVLTFLTRLAAPLRELRGPPFGVNVLRNDGIGALAVAAASGAAFVRVNVLAGMVATDQGLVEGDAAGVLRYRRAVAPGVAVLADVDVKHGTQLWGDSLGQRAGELAERAGADALIVTGAATGAPAVRAEVETVLAARPAGVPVLVGSGVTAENAAAILGGTQGAIAGTACKVEGRTTAPVDPRRVAALVAAARAAWGEEGR